MNKNKYFIEFAKKKVESIAKSIEGKNPVSKGNSLWLSDQKRSYLKNPNKFNKTRLKLLDSLIPLLGYDWKVPGTYLERIRQSKASAIRSELEQGKSLSMNLRRWLYSQQKVYEAQPEKFDKRFLSLLDDLNPLLGYDWKIYYRPKETRSIEMLHKLSSTLKSKRKLSSDLRGWIRVQRDMYRDHPSTYSTEKKEQLDALIPLLGYDWKENQRSRNRAPFDKRVAAIRDGLEKGGTLSTKDRSWINSYRNKYIVDPKSLDADKIKLLNTLNPFLTSSWNKVWRTGKKPKNFVAWIKELKEQELPYEQLSKQQKGWLQRERSRYKKKKGTYSKEKIKMLDSLNPILKRDWKKYTVKIKKKITFDNRIEGIRRKLTNGMALTESEKGFLKRQRQYYEKNIISKEREEKLDTLVPLLGYDWRKKLRILEIKTFDENFVEIKQLLENGKSLSKKQRNWLFFQKEIYLRDPESFPIYRLNSLNTLDQFLKTSWKLRSRQRKETLSFEESLAKIRHQLIVGKPLNRKQRAWLSKQRLRFKNNHPQLSKERIDSLDSINISLGYDWKMYPKDR